MVIFHLPFIFHIGFHNQCLIYGTFKYVHLSTCPCTSSSITCMALTTTWREKDICNPFFLMFFTSPLLLPLPENGGPRPAQKNNAQKFKRIAEFKMCGSCPLPILYFCFYHLLRVVSNLDSNGTASGSAGSISGPPGQKYWWNIWNVLRSPFFRMVNTWFFLVVGFFITLACDRRLQTRHICRGLPAGKI